MRHLGIADRIEIHDYGGINDLQAYLMTLAAMAGFQEKVRSIGIVRDAEDSADNAKASVDGAIARASLPGSVRTSSFILPDNVSPGNIETLCLRSVSGSPVISCLHDFISCTTTAGVVWATAHARHKADVQIFAATLESPRAYAGLAAYEGAWPWDSTAFADLFSFLQSL